MIGADTNILVRANLDDDPKESAAAQKFLFENAAAKKLFISSYAILEFAWVLKIKNRTRKEISDSLITLLDAPGIVIGERECVEEAVISYKHGKADFEDYMILEQGRSMNAPKLGTFDKKLAKENPNKCVIP